MTPNATPFQPPWKVAFYSRNARRKGCILDKRYLLNISWMLLGSSSIMWPTGEGFVKVPEQKRRNLESDVSESSFSFFPSLVFSLLRKWRTTQTFLFSKSILVALICQSPVFILNLTGCFSRRKMFAQTVSETLKQVMIRWMNGCKNRRPLWNGSVVHLCPMNISKQWDSERTAAVCEMLTFLTSTACVSFKTVVFLSKLTLFSQTVTHGVLRQGCVRTSCFRQTFQYFPARVFV